MPARGDLDGASSAIDGDIRQTSLRRGDAPSRVTPFLSVLPSKAPASRLDRFLAQAVGIA
jgi:hypothetical protein